MLNFLFTHTPLTFLIQSFWRDEAFTYLLAKKNIFDIIFLTAKDFNPPLYYILIHFWMKIFGSSEIALRSFSFIFFWATLYVCVHILLDIFKLNSKKSYLYFLLILINPLLVYYAFEARMYTLLTFLATLSYYSFYKKNSRLYFISTLLGLYTHYFMLLVVLSQLLFNYLIYKKSRAYLIMQKKIIKPVIYFAPWLASVLIIGQIFGSAFWINKIQFHTLLNLPSVVYLGYEQGTQFFSGYIFFLTVLLFAILFIGFLKIGRENQEKKQIYLYLLFWALGIPFMAALVSFFKPIFLMRYLIFTSVGFVLLLVYTLEHFRRNARIVALIILTLLTFYFHRLQLTNHSKTDFRKVAKEIQSAAKNDDLFYVTDVLDFHTAQYYFERENVKDKKVFLYNVSYEIIPAYVGKVLIPEDRIKDSLPSYPSKAYVLNHEGGYVIQSLY